LNVPGETFSAQSDGWQNRVNNWKYSVWDWGDNRDGAGLHGG